MTDDDIGLIPQPLQRPGCRGDGFGPEQTVFEFPQAAMGFHRRQARHSVNGTADTGNMIAVRFGDEDNLMSLRQKMADKMQELSWKILMDE
ncbi:hypothetical protein AA12467_0410 [Gluconobacter sphaericus NBRC 12467]|nr:hypothetical protein AA12467_0410 [Gluconobacter sphaericus NBRC 12467]